MIASTSERSGQVGPPMAYGVPFGHSYLVGPAIGLSGLIGLATSRSSGGTIAGLGSAVALMLATAMATRQTWLARIERRS